MLDIGGPELLVAAVIALIVVGPKDLPRLVRGAARVMGKARGMANEFKHSLQELEDESEFASMKRDLDEMARKEMDEARAYVKDVTDIPELSGPDAAEAPEDEMPASYDDLPDVDLAELEALEREQQGKTMLPADHVPPQSKPESEPEPDPAAPAADQADTQAEDSLPAKQKA